MPDKRQLDQWDRRHAWHPFSQMQEYCTWPQLHVERGEGCWLWDTEGKRYLDTNASVWTNTFGHNDPELNAAVQQQLGKIAHSTYLGLSHPVGAELGRQLCERAPGSLNRVFFSDNGSNAIEIALKLSYQYWQLHGQPAKQRVIGMQGGYHGDTIGTMAAGQSGRFHERFANWFLDSWHFPAPACHEVNGRIQHATASESLQKLEAYLQTEADQIACLVIEPSVQGAAGMQQQPKGFLKSVEQLCRRFKVHLILDEVFVAFGRLGSLYACTQDAVEPDFLCLAKGISGGYVPLAATLVQDRIYEACLGSWTDDRTFFHGHTFTANPIGCAVALANLKKLEVLTDSGALARTIQDFGRKLSTLEAHPNVAQIRQRGLTAAIDLCPRPNESAWPIEARVGWQVCLAARRHELLVRPLGDSLLIVPPLIISTAELDFLVARIRETLDEVLSAPLTGPCQYCTLPTTEIIAGEFVCPQCSIERSSCCQEQD
ncbi:adenosylmethionine--8-amino-7-oxononanoate transaminase [Coraliomargarita akajimensis]|uniref:Adenosylmethionine-8-amino-7-oxononanoate aminotransferase n=1 Tax=Coraliomargarita akajimensis (strain DSM 45221 / IAM 15411 / JCM 23193 / KCTC 12865 / 04OKA010-24) TaxID=583355 RepID=D5EPQ1_CORAD|nr:adenosylmethionine--8-amino-7-oxononanoate transaminase [Coraliomargarita akajimensis]ADE53788.1 aminotransferase class-III [Coraliomargarita akajimensis DSM 45221]